jgi:hypothetical protein
MLCSIHLQQQAAAAILHRAIAPALHHFNAATYKKNLYIL